jgi:hypothetical protein
MNLHRHRHTVSKSQSKKKGQKQIHKEVSQISEQAYISFEACTLNFLALKNRNSVNVSNRSLYPSCSNMVRSWNTCASCSGVVHPGWPVCGSGALVGKS